MKTKIKLTNKEIQRLLISEVHDFPKYSRQIINLASQNAQGTRPAVVGQMTDLIQQFSGKKIEEWEKWYLEKHPDAIRIATQRIARMIENFKSVMNEIDEQMIESWVRDLVIVKTFVGLQFHEAILIKTAELFDTTYRLSSRAEESKGIDGYLGEIPISIKPESYKSKKSLQEKIDARIIYYKKLKDGVTIDISELLEAS